MERILSANQMRRADEYTINTLGVLSEELVLRAGTAVASEIIQRLKGGRVLVCVGRGNNGADGRVIAQILSKTHGFTVATVNIENGIFKLFNNKYDIIVDCIFGTGLNREVVGKYKEAIEKINASGAYVVSCDIPSGLNSDTGYPLGVAVKANLTVAIGEYKLGHFLNDGVDYVGEVICKDIGISLWEDDYVKRITPNEVAKFFTPRKRNSNKGRFGKTAVIGGSKSYPGSVIISYMALLALKMGVGYSTVCIPNLLYNAVATHHPECIMTTMADDGEGLAFDKEKLDLLLKNDSLAFGMGVGLSEERYKILQYLLNNYEGRLIIDADGLNLLSKYGVDILKRAKCSVVLTPHIKEFSRLTGTSVDEITCNCINLAKEFAKEFGVILVLKSATTVISDGNEVFLNTTGCSGLSKAGSGDALSGILCGLLARENQPIECVLSGCYLFGKTAEIVMKKTNEFSMTITDVIKALPEVIGQLI